MDKDSGALFWYNTKDESTQWVQDVYQEAEYRGDINVEDGKVTDSALYQLTVRRRSTLSTVSACIENCPTSKIDSTITSKNETDHEKSLKQESQGSENSDHHCSPAEGFVERAKEVSAESISKGLLETVNDLKHGETKDSETAESPKNLQLVIREAHSTDEAGTQSEDIETKRSFIILNSLKTSASVPCSLLVSDDTNETDKNLTSADEKSPSKRSTSNGQLPETDRDEKCVIENQSVQLDSTSPFSSVREEVLQ